MKNKGKNSILSSVLAIAVLAVGLVVFTPKSADAYMVHGDYMISADAALAERHAFPGILSLDPNQIYTGEGSRIIEIRGYGFVYDSVVLFDGQDRPTTYISSTRLLMRISANDANQVGDHLVSVENPRPGGGISHPRVLEIRNSRGTGGAINFDASGAGSVNGNSSGNSLSASAVQSGAFFPSTFIQWLAFAILILFIVIIWRRLYRRKEEEPPLKHA